MALKTITCELFALKRVINQFSMFFCGKQLKWQFQFKMGLTTMTFPQADLLSRSFKMNENQTAILLVNFIAH